MVAGDWVVCEEIDGVGVMWQGKWRECCANNGRVVIKDAMWSRGDVDGGKCWE